MKIFKMFAVFVIGVASCTSFVSCSDDDKDEPNSEKPSTTEPTGPSNPSDPTGPVNVFLNGNPKKVGDMEFTYGESGRVSKIRENYTEVLFDYEPYSFEASRSEQFDLCIMINDADENGTNRIYIQLNEDGFAKYCKQIDTDGSINRWAFEYNADGQLSKMTRTEGGMEVTEISYENGNISKVKTHSEEYVEYSEYVIGYGQFPIENKGCIMMFDDTFGIDMDEMSYAYYASLLGRPTKSLPVSNMSNQIDQTNEYSRRETYSWTLNNNGLPTKLVIANNSDSGIEETVFVW